MATSWTDSNLGGVRRSTPNGPEAISHVVRELESKVRYRKVRANKATIQCPYHVSDSGFSMTLSVNLDPNRVNGKGFEVPIGYFHCWSCHRAGSWNTLSQTLDLEPLIETDNPDIIKNLRQIQWEEEYVKPDSSMMFRIEDDWVRSDGVIKARTLRRFGVKLYMKVVNVGGEYESRKKLWIPAYQNGELFGHVEARLDPEEYDPDPKYLNAPGVWASQYWVGYDAVAKWFPKHDYCSIVEGPADAMMMFQNGEPALPLLGVTSWSKTKAIALTTRYRTLFGIGDGDNAGKQLRTFLRRNLQDECNYKSVKLASGDDPANLDRDQYKSLKRIIKKKLKEIENE